MNQETPAKAPFWRRSGTKTLVGIVGGLGTGAAGIAQFFKDEWAAASLPTAIVGIGVGLISAAYVSIASHKDGSVEAELRAALTTAKSDGYQEAASELRELMQKIQANIADWTPEVGRILREDTIKLARHILEKIGIGGVRVSYYTPTAAEVGPENDSDENIAYTALSLVYASCGSGRHDPKEVHEYSASTKHMFTALRSAAPTSPPARKRVRGKSPSWRTARQLGVRANGSEPIGLLSADSAAEDPFPQQADDILILVAQLLLLIDRRNI